MTEKRKRSRVSVWIARVLYLILLFVFLLSVYALVVLFDDVMRGADEYEQAKKIAEVEEIDDLVGALDEYTLPATDGKTNAGTKAEAIHDKVFLYDTLLADGSPYMNAADKLDKTVLDRLKSTNIAALKAINPDVVGWIYVEATDISYPIMYSDSNDKYIRSSWMDSSVYLTAGTIFMDSRNNPDFSDFNTILYGHRMRDLTMFGKLKFYSDMSYWLAHPRIYIVTENGISGYDIYSVYEVPLHGDTYTVSFPDTGGAQEYIDFTVSSSIYDTGIVPTVNDSILTLSTCSGKSDYLTRWIIHAVKRG